MKALSDESINILVCIETDGEGDVIDMYYNCNGVKPCVHIAATLMGWWLMDSLECNDIQKAFDILSMQE